MSTSEGQCVRVSMLIDGDLSDCSGAVSVINPATGLAFASAPDCSDADLDRAVTSARHAFGQWRAVSIEERREALRSAGAALLGNVEMLAQLLTMEQGRPLAGAVEEIKGAAGWFAAVAELEPPVHSIEDASGGFVETRYEPLGVVCAIAPWNFPVQLAVMKIAPALLAGCTVVLKPSPYTPLATLKMGELLRENFPAGVLNIISGGDSLGPRMTAHPGFAKISFTGSTATGRQVLRAAADDFRRVTLELGGNDAAIILPDINIDAVAPRIFFGAFFNSAQVCIATKRLYIHEDIYEEFRDRLAGLVRSMPVGDGLADGVAFGPVQNRRQYDRVQALIAEARESGLTLIQGSVPEGSDGYFIPLTLVDNPPEDAPVVVEEAFGPVLPLLKFSDIDEVIRRVNASEFGLAGAVWSSDVDVAIDIGRRIDCGTLWVNQNLVLRPDMPFAGRKSSGFGIENGIEGLLEFMAPQTLYVAR